MSKSNRDIFIALIDAGLDESAVLAFVEGNLDDAAGMVEALGKDAKLAEVIWQLRSDRDAINADAAEQPLPASSLAMVSAVLDQELDEQFDAADIRRIEETGTAPLTIAGPTHPAVKVHRTRNRSLRMPSRLPRIVGSLAAAVVLVVIVSIALPNITANKTTARQGQPLATNDTGDQPAPISQTQTNTIDDAIAHSGGTPNPTRPNYRPLQQPIVVASANEALELARQGRLIVRITSVRQSTTDALTTQLTDGNELSRFAVVEGPIRNTDQALAFNDALPKFEEPMMASADENAGQDRLQINRELSGTFMLRVEPTERSFMLLLAKLRSYEGTSIELVGAVDPVTTPGSTADLSGLSQSPTKWRSRISVPVVVESIQ